MSPVRAIALAAALLVAAATTVTVASAGAGARPDEPLGAALDRIVADWQERAWIPGVAVSVRQGAALSWSAAAGVADEDSGTPLTADTAFYVASVTKPFVATAVLTLAEDGLLGLDDPLSAHLPGAPVGGGVTIRQLLGMRSGIPDYTQAHGFVDDLMEDLYLGRARHQTARELVEIAANAKPEFAPGERFAYSNTNYILLSEVLTAVTGRPWEEVVTDRVLGPLGLEGTLVPRFGEDPAVAAGHTDLDADSYRDSLAGRPYGSVITGAGAAGALVSTADDLTAFARAVWGGGFLTDDALAQMTRVDRLGYEREYGLGVFAHLPDLRTRVLGHTGGGIGYSSVLWYAPEHDLAIAVLVNDGGGEPEDLAELLLRRIVRAQP